MMELREALYTMRAMRRMRPDPVPVDVQARMIDAAIQAPTGGNIQQWRFILVDDGGVRSKLGPLYRERIADLWATLYADRLARARAAPGQPDHARVLRMQRSAQHLADHFEQTPLLLFAMSRFDPGGGSIFPAVWSAMLAARAEGVGSALTTVLNLRADAVMEMLEVPPDKRWQMACCVAFGYPTGRWGVAARRPAHEVAARNRWDGPPGFEVPDPLWPGPPGGGDV